MEWKDIPFRSRAISWALVTPAKPNSILKMLQIMNLTLPKRDLRVIKVEEADGPIRQIVLSLSKESRDLLEARNSRV